MQHDEKVLEALAIKAEEQSKELTLWAQQELGLSTEFFIKLTASIKRVHIYKEKANPEGRVFDQQPTPEDWTKVRSLIRQLLARTKPWNRSRIAWRQLIKDLRKLKRMNNEGYVDNALVFNAYMRNTDQLYRLVRSETKPKDRRYSLLVARIPDHSP